MVVNDMLWDSHIIPNSLLKTIEFIERKRNDPFRYNPGVLSEGKHIGGFIVTCFVKSVPINVHPPQGYTTIHYHLIKEFV